MIPVEKLAKLFDLTVSGSKSLKPSIKSISRINEHFEFELPESLVEFCNASENHGSWLASIGEDYEDHTHIIRINSLYRSTRRRVDGKWKNIFPRNYVIINRAFDEDCDCIDLESLNPETGEYEIVYWSPGIYEGKRYKDFPSYMEASILYWAKGKDSFFKAEFEKVMNE